MTANDYPTLHYSKTRIIKAGKALKRVLVWDPGSGCKVEYIDHFKVAYDWRNSHARPMRRVRHELAGKAKHLKVEAITAARLKRMASIRKKLSSTTIKLAEMQDLAGCRAILNSTGNVDEIINVYQAGGSKHDLTRHDDYTNSPKPDGYRGHHLVLAFQGGAEDEQFTGRQVELQIRTRLQHAWATTVEAIGLARNEDLKAGKGNEDWLRLLTLMSSEFAELEGCPIIPGTSTIPAQRASELRELNSRLKAVATLSSLNEAFKDTEFYFSKDNRLFLIQFDYQKRTVRVDGFTSPLRGSANYAREEAENGSLNSVLVEVDKVENLRMAYPNYFLDVGTFVSNLNCIVHGIPKSTEAMKLPKSLEQKSALGYDLSWVENWRKK